MEKKPTMTDSIDSEIMDLLTLVEQRKFELDKLTALTKDGWQTNCSVSMKPDGTDKKNLAVLKKDEVVDVLAYILCQRDYITKANSILFGYDSDNTAATNTTPIQGYSVYQWGHDCRKRMAVLEYNSKKAEYESLEKSLNALVSPEIRRKIELEKIKKQLGG